MIADLRAELRAASLPAVIVPDVISAAAAKSLRHRVAAAGLRPYFVADRGRYWFNDDWTEPELFERLRTLAEGVIERSCRPANLRWSRLAHGDYALTKDDAARVMGRPPEVELSLDFSAAPSEDAQIVYSNGQAAFVIPQRPGSLAVIDRTSALYRYERYVTHRIGGGEVFRLRLGLEILP